MSNSPEKDAKQSAGKGEKLRKDKRTENVAAGGNPGGSARCDLERLSAAYDEAIKNYETYYQQQGACNTGSLQYDPYSYYYPPYYSRGYRECSYAEQLADTYGHIFAEYEASLQSCEQAQTDFNTAFQYIQSLEGKEREEYIKGWKEYLQSILETCKQLSNSIEESIQSMATQNL